MFQIKIDRHKAGDGERFIRLYATVPYTASQHEIAEALAQRVIIYAEKHSEDIPMGKKLTFGEYDSVKQRRVKGGIAGVIVRLEKNIDVKFTSQGTVYR